MIKKVLLSYLPLIGLFLFLFEIMFFDTKYIIISFLSILPYFINSFNKLSTKCRYFTISAVIGSLLNLLVTENGIGGTMVFITSIALALYCTENIKLVSYFSFIAIVYHLYFIIDKIIIQFIDPNLIFENLGLSRNYPGFILVALSCFWAFTKYNLYNCTSIVIPLISFIIAYFLDGRSSMGALLLLLLGSILLYNRKYIILSVVLVIVIAIKNWDNLVYFYNFSSFAQNSIESSRIDIWKGYFSHLDILSFTFGLDYKTVPILVKFGGNPHNAFLNFHLRMGAFGLIPLLILIFNAIKQYRIRKEFSYLLLILLVYLFRIFFDSCLNTKYDFIFYTFLFYILNNNNNNNNIYRNPPLIIKYL